MTLNVIKTESSRKSSILILSGQKPCNRIHDCFKALKQKDTMLRDKLNENVARITWPLRNVLYFLSAYGFFVNLFNWFNPKEKIKK